MRERHSESHRCYHRATVKSLNVERGPQGSPDRRARLAREFALWLGLCGSLPAYALQPLVTDDTGTQPRGGNQLEAAVERERLRSSGQRTTTLALPLVYTYGAIESLEVSLELRRVHVRADGSDDGRGSGNPALGFKWRFWEDEARGLSFALKPELQIGVSRESEREGLGNARTGYAATFIVSQQMPFGAIHANASVNRVGYGLTENRQANRRTLYRLSVAPVIVLSPTWQAAIDVGVTTNPDRSERARMGYVQLAAIWSPTEDIELALGIMRKVGDGEPSSHTATVGLTWRF